MLAFNLSFKRCSVPTASCGTYPILILPCQQVHHHLKLSTFSLCKCVFEISSWFWISWDPSFGLSASSAELWCKYLVVPAARSLLLEIPSRLIDTRLYCVITSLLPRDSSSITSQLQSNTATLATAVASQPASLWRHRDKQSAYYPAMDISGLVSYDHRTQQASSVSASRGLVGNPFNLRMQSYSNAGMPSATHYQSGHYTYGNQPGNSYQHLSSTYNTGYSQHVESYQFPTAGGSGQSHSEGSVASNIILRGNHSPPVKHEDKPPLQTNQKVFEICSYSNPKPPNSEPDPTFGTDVDTLMKAIQTKSEPSPGYPVQKPSLVTSMAGFQQPRFGEGYGTAFLNQHFNDPFTAPNAVLEGARGRSGQKEARQRNKTRYGCEFPNCLRSFSQKVSRC